MQHLHTTFLTDDLSETRSSVFPSCKSDVDFDKFATIGIPGPIGATRKDNKINSSNKQKKNTRPRTEFPETWLWTEERLYVKELGYIFASK